MSDKMTLDKFFKTVNTLIYLISESSAGDGKCYICGEKWTEPHCNNPECEIPQLNKMLADRPTLKFKVIDGYYTLMDGDKPWAAVPYHSGYYIRWGWKDYCEEMAKFFGTTAEFVEDEDDKTDDD